MQSAGNSPGLGQRRVENGSDVTNSLMAESSLAARPAISFRQADFLEVYGFHFVFDKFFGRRTSLRLVVLSLTSFQADFHEVSVNEVLFYPVEPKQLWRAAVLRWWLSLRPVTATSLCSDAASLAQLTP